MKVWNDSTRIARQLPEPRAKLSAKRDPPDHNPRRDQDRHSPPSSSSSAKIPNIGSNASITKRPGRNCCRKPFFNASSIVMRAAGAIEREYGLGRKRIDLLLIWNYPAGIQRVVCVPSVERILLANSKVNRFNNSIPAKQTYSMRDQLTNVDSPAKIIPSSRRLRCHYSRYRSIPSPNKQPVSLAPRSLGIASA